jgi:hypothetical protein
MAKGAGPRGGRVMARQIIDPEKLAEAQEAG